MSGPKLTLLKGAFANATHFVNVFRCQNCLGTSLVHPDLDSVASPVSLVLSSVIPDPDRSPDARSFNCLSTCATIHFTSTSRSARDAVSGLHTLVGSSHDCTGAGRPEMPIASSENPDACIICSARERFAHRIGPFSSLEWGSTLPEVSASPDAYLLSLILGSLLKVPCVGCPVGSVHTSLRLRHTASCCE